MNITQEMSIPEIVHQYPATETVFQHYGIQPEGYKALSHENLFATARVHQLDLNTLLKDLNRAIV